MVDAKNGLAANPVDVEVITPPKGGGAYQGLEGIAGVDCFTGAGTVRVPIDATPCRGIEPKLALEYSTTNGNGPFGMGFLLSVSAISRMTTTMIPRYEDDADTFILDGVELSLQSVKCKDSETVRVYMRQKGAEFERIEYHRSAIESFWIIRRRDNSISRFGGSANSRIANPDCVDEVFSWRLSSWSDEKGNRIEYRYTLSGNLERVRYGNCVVAGVERFCFELRFEYTGGRGDTLTAYNTGFAREMNELCRSITMWHSFDEEVKVRKMSLTYESSGISQISLLTRVSITCYRGEDSMALPDLDFAYTTFHFGTEECEYALLQPDHSLPFEVDQNNFYFIDLDGEGAAGILYADGQSCLYASPMGAFTYADPVALPDFPIHKDLLRTSFMDLEGNGRYQLAVYTAAESGYYRREGMSWSPFIPFERIDTERSPYVERADLQGDHRQHKLVVEQKSLRYYPALRGAGGVGNPVERETLEDFPHSGRNSLDTLVRFVEIAGDGIAHRVLIENGYVAYFPNLGYGRFGKPVEMMHAPIIDGGLDASRLLFADLDGSGAADLVYVHPDRVDIYCNRAGKSFSAPVSIPLPESYTAGDTFHAADLLGNGTDALIFTKIDARGIRHYGMDFTRRSKPYLLRAVDSNKGLRIELACKSSAVIYFGDKAAGRAWQKPLHFPVQIAVEKRVIDAISDTVTVTDYSYADAIYDFERRDFRGFRVAEARERFYGSGDDAPRYTVTRKTWHFCAMKDDLSPMLSPHHIVADDLAEGEKSLWGQPVRQETHVGDTLVEEKEYRYKTMLMGKNAYFAYQLEALTRTMERSPSDPRIEHELTLAVDSYGNVTRKCAVAYPRRNTTGFPERLAKAQAALFARETRYAYSNTTGPDSWRLGVLTEEQTFEHANLPSPQHIFSVETLSPILNAPKRLSHKRLAYWDDARETALSYGEVGTVALLRHTDEAIFPEDFQPLTTVLGNAEMESAGYWLDGGCWWKRSPVSLYGPREQMHLPQGFDSDFLFFKVTWTYDCYLLFPTRSRAYINRDTYNETTAEIDYAAMKYRMTCDPNGALTEIRYNPLGLAEVVTERKTSAECEGEGNGDITKYNPLPRNFDAVIGDPDSYLQNMSAYYLYEPRAWQDHGKPACVVSLVRCNDVSSGMESGTRIAIEYRDAYGNTVETRRLAERGNWAVPSKTAFDCAGHVIAAYQSFFADTPCWTPGNLAGIPPVLSLYDWKGRLIRKETPEDLPEDTDCACFFFTVEYSAWEEREYDENRTMMDSTYYKRFMALPTRDEDRLDSLEKSERFHDMPVTRYLDPSGEKIAENLDGRTSYFERDADGRITSFADARRTEGCNQRTIFDMTGAVVAVQSADAGETIQIGTVFGNIAISIDGNGMRKQYAYDGLQRLTEVRAAGLGVAERIEYGEQQEDAKQRGLRGRVYRHFDQAGLLTVNAYDMRGNPREQARRFAENSASFLDWGHTVPLETAVYEERFTHNADGNPTEVTGPNGVTLLRRYNRRGYLDRVWASVCGGNTPIPLIDGIYYCAGEKRTKILYANGAYTKNRYNRLTARLELTMTATPGQTLRAHRYVYDPAGHITRVRDMTAVPTFTKGQVALPYLDYTYDAFYRLETAMGRELAGEANDLTSITPYTRDYAYDDGGNLLAVRHIGAAGRYTLSMEMDDTSNRVLTATQGGDTWQMAYDGRGNPLAMPNLRDMRWDYEGRLAAATTVRRDDGANDEEQYVYDHAGVRVRKITRRLTAGGVAEIRKTYLGAFSLCAGPFGEECMLRVTDAGTPLATLRFDGAGTAPEVSYQVADHTESVVLELDEHANLLSAREYFPFGEIALDLAGKLTARQKAYLFAGKELDVTGLFCFETRYYSSYLHRFLSPDAFENVKVEMRDSYHLYAYCHGDPVNYQDLDGRCAWNLRERKKVYYYNSGDSDDSDGGGSDDSDSGDDDFIPDPADDEDDAIDEDEVYKDTMHYGAYLKGLKGDVPYGMENPHAHHIVFKGEYSKSVAMQKILKKSRSIMAKFGIFDYKKNLYNLMWAPNRAHTIGNARAVMNKLKKYLENHANATTDEFGAKLQRIGAKVFG